MKERILPLVVNFSMKEQFEQAHRQRYGFIVEEKTLIVEAVSVEVVRPMCQMKQLFCSS